MIKEAKYLLNTVILYYYVYFCSRARSILLVFEGKVALNQPLHLELLDFIWRESCLLDNQQGSRKNKCSDFCVLKCYEGENVQKLWEKNQLEKLCDNE